MRVNRHNKQAVLLYITTFGGVLVGILVSVLNTRNLSPADYGDVYYVVNLFTFISSFLLFGYFVSGSRLLAITQNESIRRSIRGIMVGILGITVFITMLLMGGAAVVQKLWFNKEVVSLVLWSIPICAAPLMLSYINTTAQGDNHIGRLAAARLLPASCYLLVGYGVYTAWGASSKMVLLLQNGIYVVVLGSIIVTTRPDFRHLKAAFVRLEAENKQYGKPVYWGSVANVSLGYLAGVTLGMYSPDNVSVGFYTMALTIASPLSMLPSIIGTTYFRQFAVSDRIDRKIMVGTIGLTCLGYLCFIVCIHPIVHFLYADSYAKVAGYASLLAVGTSIHGFGDMLNRFLGAHGQGRSLRNGAFLSGAILLIGNFVFVYFWGINGAVLTRILGSLGSCGSMIYYYRKYRNGVNYRLV